MDDKIFLKILQDLFHITSLENKKLVLMGDLNINLLNAMPDSNVTAFIDTLSSFLLLPSINLPTRITKTSKTLITPNANINTPITEYSYRDWSKFNQEEFLLDYFDIDWDVYNTQT